MSNRKPNPAFERFRGSAGYWIACAVISAVTLVLAWPAVETMFLTKQQMVEIVDEGKKRVADTETLTGTWMAHEADLETVRFYRGGLIVMDYRYSRVKYSDWRVKDTKIHLYDPELEDEYFIDYLLHDEKLTLMFEDATYHLTKIDSGPQ